MSYEILHLAGFLLYLAATALALARLVVGDAAKKRHLFVSAFVAAFIVHCGLLGELVHERGQLPFGNLFEILTFLSWCIAGAFIIILVITRQSILSFFVAPLVAILVGWAYLHGRTEIWQPTAAGGLFWLHVLFSILGLVGLVLGVFFAWMYEIQSRSLRSKARGPLARLIPSLETCDRWGRSTLATGFVLYTFGILHAAFFSLRAKGTWTELSTKEFGSLVVWLIFAALIQLRLIRGPSGRTYALLATAGLIAIAITLAGIR